MATLQPPVLAPKRNRLRFTLVIAAIIVVLGGVGWFVPPLFVEARIYAAQSARVVCSCRYISYRPLDQCQRDFVEGISKGSLSEETEARSVTARVSLLSSQTATFKEGSGCVLERWDD